MEMFIHPRKICINGIQSSIVYGETGEENTFFQAITPAKLKNDSLSYYGFGWFIEKPGVEVAHSGGWVAFGTYIDRFISTNQTYILLDNSANHYARNIVKQILEGKSYFLPKHNLFQMFS